jgi:ribosomal protein L29
MKKNDISQLDREYLVELVNELNGKLLKSRFSLSITRKKLLMTRITLKKLMETVKYQRQRIFELHKQS